MDPGSALSQPESSGIKTPRALVRQARSGKLLSFDGLEGIIKAHTAEEVLPALQQVEQQVEGHSLFAAGFVSYEASLAFDPYLKVRPDDSGFPLLWFGLFSGMQETELPRPDSRVSLEGLNWSPSITPGEYSSSLDRIREYIRAGDTYQVNFTYRLRAECSLDPLDIFCTIYRSQDPPYAAFIDTGEFALCSFSPEMFFTLKGQTLRSRPMKGTAARGLDNIQDRHAARELEKSEKDRAENVMIVDMVRNDMGRIAHPGSVHVPQLFSVEKYFDVWQMTSLVESSTSAPLDAIFSSLFPPASITGAPKIRTTEIIAELETAPRRIYTGAMGYVAPGRQAQFNVAIRTLLLDQTKSLAEYGIGGGIVWDSRTDMEMNESRVKARVLATPGPGFDLLESILWQPSKGFPYLSMHLERLQESAEYFDFPLDLQRVHSELQDLGAALPQEPHKIRLLVSRKGAVKVQAVKLDTQNPGFSRLPLAASAVDPDNRFLYHKTTNREVYNQALAARPGCRDVLLYNHRGQATESTIANLAVEKNGELLTPPVSCGLLPGVYRSLMLEQGVIRESVLSIQDVLDSPRVFLMNSVRGMHQVDIIS
ncbi:aminodeoxychorismate synthase component I [Desulfonatronospira sp. MSAO_Bac3]|uniref:aminodeoxychorismate synthase component I n=1 Tax=Desulfonatronospira sp. MSAO_Bac3 TaxID=2293857 RepID=UPI000FEE509C|nr:aminodeoxychorismate synthase component I [Desulfonatronospira sp. MSAO_Bac3]RQD73173.1 MAG: aminodeoxychorismate synthase component I [Desulfonatronospira sp. MSAO_Bac3]